MILLIDNYDSFVFNLARYFQRLGHSTQVLRNDAVNAADVRRLAPAAVVLSPGPCAPPQAGCSLEVVRQLYGEFPILGVCLGHQAIAAAWGAEIIRAPRPIHGMASSIYHDGRGIFAGLPNPFAAARYHSLVVDEKTLPAELEISARSEDGLIMAIRHRQQPVVGVQFHPESILTDCGYPLLAAFLRRCGINAAEPVPGLEAELEQHGSAPPYRPSTPIPY